MNDRGNITPFPAAPGPKAAAQNGHQAARPLIDWMSNGMVVVDVETTGTEPQRPSMIEIAAVAWNGSVFPPTFRPRPGCEIDLRACEVNGHWPRDLDRLSGSYYDAIERFLEWCRSLEGILAKPGSLMLAGWSVDFDRDFLEHALTHDLASADRPPWQHRVYDAHTLSVAYLRTIGHQVPDRLYSHEACALLGVDPEPQPHRAANGVRMTCSLFARIHANLNRLAASIK